ncbi:MAG: hypothetical protein OXC83_07320 [Chloroflexi bacterium]|nr:hypothetical protein [Chloroflexota bacterium]
MTTSEQSTTTKKDEPTHRWTSLVDVFPQFDGPEPTVVRFSSGEKREAGTWTDLYGQIGSWLARHGKIKEPVQMPAAPGRFIVNTDPVHAIERFSRSFELPNGLWLEVDGRPQLLLDRAIMLLEMFEIDPASVDVYLEQRGQDGWIR